jgi:hypothetical protein
MKWINRERMKVDRVVCLSLIKKFIDLGRAIPLGWCSVRDP